ncbi:MAG: glycosyltransferase [Cyclobacteriaceae bacterium]|nr:glycosyltransferase [Cyclobacteriaceae bacterium]MCH8515290.1 glycosyltransferase [Cyclobacteriaceae bacterium]
MPTFSIIIPVFNNAEGLERCLIGVFDQSIPKDQFEVFVIDNGSIDDPAHVASKFPVNFILENRFKGSPYSARNRGLEKATGDIVVFLDTTCKPSKEWLISGLNCLKNDVDLIGGAVKFDVNHSSSVGEIYDSVSNIKMKETIETRKAAVGCNVFVKRKVIDKLGHFEEGLRSGGDLRWTHAAVKNDFILKYCEDAYVSMTPKTLPKLFQKTIRVSKGHPKLWLESGDFLKNFIKRFLFFWLPPNPIYLYKNIKESSFPEAGRYFTSLFFIRYLFRVISAFGFLIGFFKILNRQK